MSYLNMILSQIGMEEKIRQDAKYTAALDQDLEFVKAQTYDIEYPEFKARRLLPMDTSVDSGAESFSYRQWDEYGMAEIIANYADDLPMVDTLVEKFAQNIESVGAGYQYSVQDLRRAAMANNQLDLRRARACRKAVERKIDDVAALGDAKTKLKGLINHPNVTILTAATDGTSTRWVGGRASPKAAADILQDLYTMWNEIFNTTLEVHQANTLVLPLVEYGHIAQTPVGVDNQTTILKSYLANGPMIDMVEPWYKLNTADAAGTGPRAVMYQRDPEVLEFVLPQDFEQFPPQARGLNFVIPAHARVGGVVMYYPLACVYMDGI